MELLKAYVKSSVVAEAYQKRMLHALHSTTKQERSLHFSKTQSH